MEALKDVFGDYQINSCFDNCKIDRISFYKKKNEITFVIKSDKLIKKDMITELERTLETALGAQNVSVSVSYNTKTVNLSTISDIELSQYIHEAVSEIFPPAICLLLNNHPVYDDGYLEIGLKYAGADILLKHDIDRRIEEIILRDFHQAVDVYFVDSDFDNKEFLSRLDEERAKTVSEILAYDEKNQKEKPEEQAVTEATAIGNSIEKSAQKIAELNDKSGVVVIEGKILDSEIRTLKTGKMLYSGAITDKTSTIQLKAFIEKEQVGVFTKLLSKDAYVKIRGDVKFDKFIRDIAVRIKDVQPETEVEKMDNAPEKRVELHLHTQMSANDAVSSAKDLIKRAIKWGHKAIAITDHGVVQAFPEAMATAKGADIKVIYGVEAYLIDNVQYAVKNAHDYPIDDATVVFDIETTGLDNNVDKIIEIGAIKVKNGEIIDEFSTFVNPHQFIPVDCIKLTKITDDMVQDAPDIEKVMADFIEFVGDCPLVAHNASFDVGFILKACEDLGIDYEPTSIDTLQLSRTLVKGLDAYKLDYLARHFKVELNGHHRAVNDAQCTAKIYFELIKLLKENGINDVANINDISFGVNKKERYYHAIILCKNMEGLMNLYKLISISHMEYFHKKPRILKNIYEKYSEGLMIGSACEQGELFTAVFKLHMEKKKPEPDNRLIKSLEKRIDRLCNFYDYFEIQPLGNNEFLVRNGQDENRADGVPYVDSFDDVEQINKRIVELGEKYNKLVVATCDVHFIDPETEVIRRILMAGQGFNDADNQAPLYFRTTEEMLDEFKYLGEEKAYEVVVTNTNKIADMIGDVRPIPDKTYPPEIPGAEQDIQDMSYNKARRIYGDVLPEIVEKRIEKELNSIITNGFSVMYMIAHKLVAKSLSDGYLVGSRGSVGSSFIAFLTDITEVNALPPHYVCKKCKHSEFITDGSVSSGVDMADKNCPCCGELMYKDGHDIPFETFLGFNGDKEPDIDLNFSGEYQHVAHKFTTDLFGEKNVYKAGTTGTYADKTAYGYVKKYYESKGQFVRDVEINRLVSMFTGIKRTTGQHPAGLMIVPKEYDVNMFTPIQRPANDMTSDVITTHFDYHSISGKLLKLDLLGHDDPTMIKMLEDLTSTNAREIDLSDQAVMRLFTSTESLGVKPEDIDSEVGTFAVPEFGTKFVRQMLIDTQPHTFSELVRISGLSHGTDVWLNNAQDIVKNDIAPFSETICTRDDIMTYLMYKNLEPIKAFKIMEDVRKGKGLTEEYIGLMKENNVPDWYIESCQKIKYMFPKAHAVAYVTMAYRIAYYKVHYPIEFYCAYYTVRADDFEGQIMINGKELVMQKIAEYEAMGKDITAKDQNVLTILEVVNEMYARNISFLPVDIYKSHATKFLPENGMIRPPLNSLAGVPDSAAISIMQEREKGPFDTMIDFTDRTKITKTCAEILKNLGIIDFPESDQVGFDMF